MFLGTLGALHSCPMGTLPIMPLVVLPNTVMGLDLPAATVLDNFIFLNMEPYITCKILTAMALGVPIPCIPLVSAPWIPGGITVMINDAVALDSFDSAQCVIGGKIEMFFSPAVTIIQSL